VTPTVPNESSRGRREHADLPHSCGRCDARWSGYDTAHCASCHVTFTGVSGFDAHRKADQCRRPGEVGLSPVEGRAYEAWGRPDR